MDQRYGAMEMPYIAIASYIYNCIHLTFFVMWSIDREGSRVKVADDGIIIGVRPSFKVEIFRATYLIKTGAIRE